MLALRTLKKRVYAVILNLFLITFFDFEITHFSQIIFVWELSFAHRKKNYGALALSMYHYL